MSFIGIANNIWKDTPGIGGNNGPINGGNDAFTTVLLHMNGVDDGTSFPDDNAGGSAHTWTAAGNFKTKTTQFKFPSASGRPSIATGASGDYLATPDSVDWHMGSGDYTIDFWFRRVANLGNFNIFYWWGTPNLGSYIGSDDKIFFGSNMNPSGVSFNCNTVITDTLSWHHYAVVRTGDDFKLFLDGVQDNTTFTQSGTMINSANDFIIGNYLDKVSFPYNGFMDEFRISKGIARWTSNFTPPTVAYF